VKWVDEPWPRSLQKALGRLWEMHGEQKHRRTKDALQHLEQKFNHQHEIRLLQKDLKMAQDELKTVVGEKQVLLALKAKAE
jgi:tRNA U34 5-carboxymethylaminomethyl modifying GTPase MnmE/TrmE